MLYYILFQFTLPALLCPTAVRPIVELKCKECAVTLPSLAALHSHSLLLHPAPNKADSEGELVDRPYKCSNCDKTFTR